MNRLLASAFCLAAGLLSARGARAADSPETRRVLFIGNSLTYFNDLPAAVAALSEPAASPQLVCEAVVGGGYNLEDHWHKGDALRAIRQGSWSFVVLQQGPSASEEGRTSLIQWTRRFAAEIRKARAVPALYSVWPSVSRRQDFDGVLASYREAARGVDGILLPAGEAWRMAWKRDPALALYSDDGLHPTPAGSYLAALVIYARLSGHSPVGLPAKPEIPAEQAKILQEAAAEAIAKFPD